MGSASGVVDAIWSDRHGRLGGSLGAVPTGGEFGTRMPSDVHAQDDGPGTATPRVRRPGPAGEGGDERDAVLAYLGDAVSDVAG